LGERDMSRVFENGESRKNKLGVAGLMEVDHVPYRLT
jgi:hypothetical protein